METGAESDAAARAKRAGRIAGLLSLLGAVTVLAIAIVRRDADLGFATLLPIALGIGAAVGNLWAAVLAALVWFRFANGGTVPAVAWPGVLVASFSALAWLRHARLASGEDASGGVRAYVISSTVRAFAALGVLFALVYGLVVFFRTGVDSEERAGRRFGETANDAECLEEASRREAGWGRYTGQFLRGCLSVAGVSPMLCERLGAPEDPPSEDIVERVHVEVLRDLCDDRGAQSR